ncbi:glutamate receptor ionotropic, delta-2-like isoform X2 [Pecten maximus]|nr:glutamate receptor ionotropic, delta-2-like isoform X2 [Pecten maximus]
MIFNILWINITTSEIYDVTQTIERSRNSVDIFLVFKIPLPTSQAIGVLQELGIPYIRMCVIMTTGGPQAICLPKYGSNLNFRKNILYSDDAKENTDQTLTGCRDSTCDVQSNSCQPDKDMAMNCNGSDVYPIDNDSNIHLSRIVTSLMATEKWKNVLIFYESVFEKNMRFLFDDMSKYDFIARSTHIIDRTAEKEFLDIFEKSTAVGEQKSLQIAVLCKDKCLKVLEAIKTYDEQKKALKAVYYFAELLLVSTGSSEKFHDALNDSTFHNIAIVSLPSWVSGEDEMERNCSNEYSSMMHLIHSAAKMTLIKNYSGQTTFSNMFLEQMEKYQTSLSLLWFPVDTLMWNRDGRFLHRVGLIHLSGGHSLSESLFPNKEFGFNGRQLLVSTLAYYPFVEHLGNNSYDGLCFDILRQLAKDMNFTYRLTTSPDLEWGVTDERGLWSGLIGQLQRNEVDLAASPLTVLSLREIVMDFTHPFFYDATVLLMTKEDPNTKKWRTYIDPFHWILLACIGGCLVVVSLFACLLDRISPYRVKVGLQPWSYLDVLWYMYGALIGRGGGRLRGTQVARILVGSWWIFCVVLIATYTGNLVAFLTVTKDFLPFQGVEGMVQQDVYSWGVIGGTSWVTMFQMSSLPVFKAVYTGMVRFNRTDPDVLSMDQDVHIDKVLRGNYVHIGDRSQIQVKMANECSLYTGSAEILPVQYSFGLPNGSPLTELFSHKIMAMHENGLISCWKRRRWPKRDFCPESLQTYTKVISLADIQSAFYLLGVGLVLAFLSVLFEVTLSVVKVYREKHENTNTVR